MAADHAPVLLEEVLEALAIRPDGAYLDSTYGRGGHAKAILSRLREKGSLVVIDRDPDAIAAARKELGADPRVRIEQGNFAEMGAISASAGIEHGFDGILLDLGVSSPQLDEAEREIEAGHRAGAAIEAEMRRIGLADVRREPFPVYAWGFRGASIQVRTPGGRRFF